MGGQEQAAITRDDYLERAKTRAEAIVPILRTLREELGDERAISLIRKAISAEYRRQASEWFANVGAAGYWETMRSYSVEGFERAQPIKVGQFEVDDEHARLDVVECKYAQFFNELGEPELGEILMCDWDYDEIADIEGVELDRPQTLMRGGEFCEFRYRLDREKAQAVAAPRPSERSEG